MKTTYDNAQVYLEYSMCLMSVNLQNVYSFIHSFSGISSEPFLCVTQCQAFEIRKSDMVSPLSWLLESGEPMLYASGKESWGNDQ